MRASKKKKEGKKKKKKKKKKENEWKKKKENQKKKGNTHAQYSAKENGGEVAAHPHPPPPPSTLDGMRVLTVVGTCSVLEAGGHRLIPHSPILLCFIHSFLSLSLYLLLLFSQRCGVVLSVLLS
eukprot:TRINITY_DN12100_c1_g2_i1.p3 TRINITY_DN12100_c1_g2~~TRINITY_DN12100_c1_g2_i1.p3  ORF type:complete len:124 (+),score=19.89 TRINITY_DN12100_c1_g2_i1:160-531(+)